MTDEIDISSARLGSRDSIDVRTWPIITTITRLTIHGDGRRMAVIPEFAHAKAWPRVPNVEGGPINWTLWMGSQVAGEWRVLAICTCVDDDYVPTGNVLEPGHIPSNLYYYADAPMATYQPAVGEAAVFFVTSGCTRRANTQGIPQPGRSQVVRVPLQAGTWTFEAAPTTPPVPPVVVTPPPAPPGTPTTLQDLQTVALLHARALETQSRLIQHLQDRADARVELCASLEQDLRDKLRQLDERLVLLENRPAPTVPTQAVFRVSYRDVALNREIIAGLRVAPPKEK